MKHIKSTAIFLLFISYSTISNSQMVENSIYYDKDYSGLYYGYKTKSKKQLIKLYIKTFNYTLPESQSKYDLTYGIKNYFNRRFYTYPEKMFFLIEYYDNKKGKGKPIKSEFFDAYYYNIDPKLYKNYPTNQLVFFKGRFFTDENQKMQENKRYNFHGGIKVDHSKNMYELYPINNNIFELAIGHSGKWKLSFTKQDQSASKDIDKKLNPYIEMISKKLASTEGESKKIHLGSQNIQTPYSPRGNFESTSIYTNEIGFDTQVLKVIFDYNIVTNMNVTSLYNELAADWNYTLNKEVTRFFKERAFSLKEKLIYFPKIDTIRLYSKLPSGIQKTEVLFHSHNILVERTPLKQIKFRIKPTSLNIGYAYSSNETKSKQEKYTQQKLKENRLKRIEEEKRLKEERIKELQEIEKWTKTIQSKGFKTKDAEFWNQFPRNGSDFRKLYEGNFNKLDRKGFLTAILNEFKWHMSDNCRDLLPANRVYERVNITTSEKKYSHTNYHGGFDMGSFEAVYDNETTTREYDLYYDPKYEDLFNDKDNTALSKILNEYKFDNLNNAFKQFFKIKADEAEFEMFLSSLNCDSEGMNYINENLFRYLNNLKSLQAE